MKNSRFALQKNPWNLSTLEAAKVADVQKANQSLYRAYLLKESLAAILDGRHVNVARKKILEWIDWATRSRLRPFQKLARTVRSHLEGILAYVATRLSNGRTEGLNGKIRTGERAERDQRSEGAHEDLEHVGGKSRAEREVARDSRKLGVFGNLCGSSRTPHGVSATEFGPPARVRGRTRQLPPLVLPLKTCVSDGRRQCTHELTRLLPRVKRRRSGRVDHADFTGYPHEILKRPN